jgi:S-adenosylmethionine:tRNA ribosyltransferase-isomerase
MNTKLEKALAKYDFNFPEDLIAKRPAKPRESARLMVLRRDKKGVSEDTFASIGEYLPKDSVLVFNQTKVVPARMFARKETGGKVEMLYLFCEKGSVKALLGGKVSEGNRLYLSGKTFFDVLKKADKGYYLKPSFDANGIMAVLGRYGKTPIPPYIKNSPLGEVELRREYQTVFARRAGSVAAPTASLHFSKKLMVKLARTHVIEYVTLHVNLGTFAPLKEDNLSSGKLHSEGFDIPKDAAERLNRYRREGKKIIAVGTTVARTLESASDENGKLKKLSGNTDLFIREGYKFKFIDGMITNFHVPKSSLLMLVGAFMGRKELMDAYRHAIKGKYRLFSFGDGMLIL